MKQLFLEVAHDQFREVTFAREALVAAVRRKGLSRGWWLTEADTPPGRKPCRRESEIAIDEIFSECIRNGGVFQMKDSRWRFRLH